MPPVTKKRKREMRPKGFWQNLRNVRHFFETFAKGRGFEPTQVDKWKEIPLTDFSAREVRVYTFIYKF